VRQGNSRTTPPRRWVGNLVVLVAVIALLYLAMPSQGMQFASPATSDEVTIVEANLAGRDLMTADREDPVVLNEDPGTPFSMVVRNNTDKPVEVWFTRFEGTALAIEFLHYDLKLDLTIPPNATRTVNTEVDFLDISNSATGYLDGALQIYDVEKDAVAQQEFVADVQGKATSQVGLVAIELLLLAVVCVVEIVVRIFRNSLPRNRFMRGLMFAFTGGVVMVAIVLGLAALRIALLPNSTWIPLVIFAAIIGFVLGYIAPGPIAAHDEEAERVTLDLVAAEQVARVSGQHTGPQDVPAYSSGDHGVVSLESHPSGDHAVPHHDSGSISLPSHDSGSHNIGATNTDDA
jgi:hypothetical protein